MRCSVCCCEEKIIIPIQKTKREFMMIVHQKKAKLDNDVTIKNNTDSSSGIQLTASKVAQYRWMAENRRERKGKKET